MKINKCLFPKVSLIVLILILILTILLLALNSPRTHYTYSQVVGQIKLEYPRTWSIADERLSGMTIVKSLPWDKKVRGVIVITYGNLCQENVDGETYVQSNWKSLTESNQQVQGFSITDIATYSIKEKAVYSYSYNIPLDKIAESRIADYARDMFPSLSPKQTIQVNVVESVVNKSYVIAVFLTTFSDQKAYFEAKEIIESIDLSLFPCRLPAD
ncbi:MAG TPA: hypothetical protein GXX60_07585 [Anaerolineaceae bacterium]|nr:hypothetical protein [Anaerolineaceae bacterium]